MSSDPVFHAELPDPLPQPGDTFLLELTQATIADNAVNTGLGANAFGGINLVDATAPDLIVAYSGGGGAGQLFVYSDPVVINGISWRLKVYPDGDHFFMHDSRFVNDVLESIDSFATKVVNNTNANLNISPP